MEQMQTAIKAIKPLNAEIMARVQTRLDNLTKPIGSLAALEQMAKQFAGAAQTVKPALPRKAIILLAADHGVAAAGVSAYPQVVTAQMVQSFARGQAVINALAGHAGAKLVLADIGVKTDLAPDLPIVQAKVRPGTDDMRYGPAMQRCDALAALHAGMKLAQDVIDSGVQVIGLGEMGIANTTASAALTSALTGRSPAEVVGRGTGIKAERLEHKAAVVAEAISTNQPDPQDVIGTVAKVGGLEIAGLAGIVLACASRGVLVMLDGFTTTVAALVAYQLAPAVGQYLVASHLSREPGHAVVLAELGLKPGIKLDMYLGEGSGAAFGLTMLDAGVKVLNEMATFDEAKVAYVLHDLSVTNPAE